MLTLYQLVIWAALPIAATHVALRYLRLRFIPGPFAAALTDFWRWRKQNNSTFYGPELATLHAKYGKLVRIGPNLVSVSDPAATSIIYGTNPLLVKGPSYHVVVGLSKGKLVHSLMTMSETQQSAVMKGIGTAFTPNAVLGYEKFIDESAQLLISQLQPQKTFDMTKWFQLFAMDVLNRNAFGQSPGFLEKGEDVDDMLKTVEARFAYYNTWAAVPGIEYLIHKNPMFRWMTGSAINRLANLAHFHLQQRRAEEAAKSHSDLLQKYLNGQARYPETISDTNVVGLVVSSIAAGADTTATTLIATLFFAMKHPEVMAKMKEEISAKIEAGALSDPPTASEVFQLPYLDATIKESMRVFPIIVSGLDRITPPGGQIISGQLLPGGTVVACHPESIHRDHEVFGADADTFRPERWLDSDKDQLSRMERAFLGFGKGKRICIGRHIALLEMKKLIPLLLMKFKMELVDPEIEIEERVKINSVRYTLPIMVSLERIGVA